ncbi:MAG: hypothetical protein J0I14_16245 [Propionibacteriaceae bacterium]|jgi:hypothetical protein|nr:hypothetical protein [Propionibacteriaceae bacterium]
MRTDRTAFAVGISALLLAGLGLWSAWGQIDWRVVGFLVPAALVVIGVGMLLLSQRRN